MYVINKFHVCTTLVLTLVFQLRGGGFYFNHHHHKENLDTLYGVPSSCSPKDYPKLPYVNLYVHLKNAVLASEDYSVLLQNYPQYLF